MKTSGLGRQCVAEVVGTYILVFFGTGCVHAAVLAGAQSGIWQVGVVWGVAVALAIYAISASSGAHINPAITAAMVAFRGFPARKAPFYIAAQLLGALLAAATLYGLFGHVLHNFESAAGIVRGQGGSELSAMVYGEYFPNPAIARAMNWPASAVTEPQAMLAEGIGTAFLAFFVFALTDARNRGGPRAVLGPLFIGLTVSIVISVIAPLTQAGLNPARDFGPRLFAWLAGWGDVAIPGPRGGFFTVYVLAPTLGAIVGAAAWQYLIRPGLPVLETAVQHRTALNARRRAMNSVRSVQPVQLLLVGGFLGAGKTTLLWQAARSLAAGGRHVGLITNDQAPDLVDTALLTRQGLDVREVAGSCFCCNFPALITAAEALAGDVHADVLIAEPVGSCTDLSATILQPLKDKFARRFVLSPLSVLVDPERLADTLLGRPGRLHDSAAYIVRKQLEEADVIVLNKTDLLPPEKLAELVGLLHETFPGTAVRCISALTGQGVNEWLDSVHAGGCAASAGGAGGGGGAGKKLLDIDYDIYAEGEAVLGWLNASVRLSMTAAGQACSSASACACAPPAGWADFARTLMEGLRDDFRQRGARVGHVKLLLSSAGRQCVANLTSTDGEVSIRGQAGPADRAELVLNARVEMPPEELESLIRRRLSAAAAAGVAAEIVHLQSLRPGRPRPTHRYRCVVEP
jgi:MIP family channel proteins